MWLVTMSPSAAKCFGISSNCSLNSTGRVGTGVASRSRAAITARMPPTVPSDSSTPPELPESADRARSYEMGERKRDRREPPQRQHASRLGHRDTSFLSTPGLRSRGRFADERQSLHPADRTARVDPEHG